MIFTDTTFENTKVDLDMNQYIRCTFKNCGLVYSGSGAVSLEGCTFHEVKWQFAGYAANTLAFMQGMYNGSGVGGKKLIEGIFDQIRFGELVAAN